MFFRNGPDWNQRNVKEKNINFEDTKAHIARCYAALCLGYIGDKRAYETLVRMMQENDYLDNKYNISEYYKVRYPISRYSAYGLGHLGDPRAIEPLLTEMKKGKEDLGFAAIQVLAMFRDIRTIKPIISYASGLKYFSSKIPGDFGKISRIVCLSLR